MSHRPDGTVHLQIAPQLLTCGILKFRGIIEDGRLFGVGGVGVGFDVYGCVVCIIGVGVSRQDSTFELKITDSIFSSNELNL